MEEDGEVERRLELLEMAAALIRPIGKVSKRESAPAADEWWALMACFASGQFAPSVREKLGTRATAAAGAKAKAKTS